MTERAERAKAGPRQASAIFAATLDLLVEQGYEGLAMESIASRSGVNKTTIYRWWPSKDAVLAAALVKSDLLAFAMPDTGSLRGDLLALMREITQLLTGANTAPIVATVLAAAPRRPELAAVAHTFFVERLTREQPMFERAIGRGELPLSVDPAMIMDLLAGAIWFRILLRNEPLTPDYLNGAVDLVLQGTAGRIPRE
ncbi:TetR/AcrR family transcriptional regulator [Nocardia sp. KC 131]|uniref:TetR/AcrR family transcriptional regulator n=1 Tax=Nocardia arseniciresistens TaxID=3392119 RepID=UPI00398F01FA